MTKARCLPHLSLAGAMILAGGSVVAGKLVASRLPIFLASECSLILAAICLYALVRYKGMTIFSVRRRDLAILALQALCGVFLFRVLLLHGLKHTTAGEAGLIASTLPAVVGLFAFILLKERLIWNRSAGIAAAIAGMALMNARAFGGGWSSSDLLILGAVCAEALFTVLRKKVGDEVSPVIGTIWICLFAALWFLLPAAVEAARFDPQGFGWVDLCSVGYYGLVATALAYALFMYGAAGVPAATAGIFSSLVPVAGVFLAHFILGESLLFRHYASLLLVLLGIALADVPGFAAPTVRDP